MAESQAIERLKKMLVQERAANAELRADLQTSAQREKEARAEVARLKARLRDLGESEDSPHRRGYRACDAAMQARMKAMNHLGLNYSQIGRRLGFSLATVSLVCRDKYPPKTAKN
jgi:hypothetical protein